MEFEPQAYIDAVLTSERELFVRPGQHLANGRSRRTIMEMLCGWCAVHNIDMPVELIEPTEKNWNRAIGLVVCGLAERIKI